MTTKRNLGQCQVEGCRDKAKYGIFRTQPNGRKEWLYVCRLHEGIIGQENMRHAGGYYKKETKNEDKD